MAAPTFVQAKHALVTAFPGGTTLTVGPAQGWNQPVTGNLIFVGVAKDNALNHDGLPSGFTLAAERTTAGMPFSYIAGLYRIADGSETSITFNWTGSDGAWLLCAEYGGGSLWSLTDAPGFAWDVLNPANWPDLAPDAGNPAVLVYLSAENGVNAQPASTAVRLATSPGFPGVRLGDRLIASAAASYTDNPASTPGIEYQIGPFAFQPAAGPITPPVDPGYDPPEPGGALLEIYATSPGAYRWDEANWDEAVWSSSSWQDVTPEGIRVVIQWGAQRPELGILADTEAGAWNVEVYDPDRILDPANADSQFVSDLKPGLPIRLSHRGVVIRRGVVESIGHSYIDDRGQIRATDAIATLVLADVPFDTALGDTLRERARTAISAAGIVVPVEPDPPSGDPVLSPWDETEEGAPPTTGHTAWEWIADAARQVLHVPYIDREGVLRFRDYLNPLARGRTLASPELVNLLSLVQVQGQYSIVQARETVADGSALIERRLTPLPRYGARIHTRDDPTPDAADWAEAVLADRGHAGLRWVPGELYPLTADSVELLATIEPLELVSLQHLEADPPVAVNARVLGGTVTVIGKKDSAAIWRFRFETAQAPNEPLVEDGDPDEFLYEESGHEYLYVG
jgi:hypothetical protein